MNLERNSESSVQLKESPLLMQCAPMASRGCHCVEHVLRNATFAMFRQKHRGGRGACDRYHAEQSVGIGLSWTATHDSRRATERSRNLAK
jgi:hypothetical protein